MREKVAVIAGTKVDTQMGVDYINAKDPRLKPYYYNVSPTPDDQRVFQYGDTATKERIIKGIFDDAESKGIQDFFIYCNSLSAAFDFEEFGSQRCVNVVTPIMAYRELATQYKSIAIIAANGLSAYNIEREILQIDPPNKTFCAAIGELVRAIEAKMPSEQMMEHFRIKGLLEHIEALGADCLILGCTHFPYFMEEMEKLTRLPLIDPADQMYEMLIEKMKE